MNFYRTLMCRMSKAVIFSAADADLFQMLIQTPRKSLSFNTLKASTRASWSLSNRISFSSQASSSGIASPVVEDRTRPSFNTESTRQVILFPSCSRSIFDGWKRKNSKPYSSRKVSFFVNVYSSSSILITSNSYSHSSSYRLLYTSSQSTSYLGREPLIIILQGNFDPRGYSFSNPGW